MKLNVTESCGFKASKFPSNLTWVRTRIHPANTRQGFLNAHMRLHHYLHGANKLRVTFTRGAPEISSLLYNKTTGVITGYDVAFYINTELYHIPSAPTNPDVNLELWEELPVYSRAFGDYGGQTNNSRSSYVKKQLKQLDQALKKANITNYVHDGLFLLAVYNPLGHAHGRKRYEVMRIIDDAKPKNKTRKVDN